MPLPFDLSPTPTPPAGPAAVPPALWATIGVDPAAVTPEVWDAALAASSHLVAGGTEQAKALDPMSLAAIAAIILAVVQAYQQCKTPPAKAAAEWRAGPGILRQFTLTRLVRRYASDSAVHGTLGLRTARALAAAGAAMSEGDVGKLFAGVSPK